MLAWANNAMYDASTAGAVGAALVTTLTSSDWQTIMLVNGAGSHLVAVNGADNGILYNEGGAARLILGDGVVANTWKNLDPKKATSVTTHQRRLWASELNSTVAWYLPPDSIYGIFTAFDFGPQFYRGGYLAFLATWTMDDGNGAEDHLVAVSSTGIAVVYSGTDPSNATTWGLVGAFYIGSPLTGRKTYTKVGGDLYIVTQQGIVSMSGLLTSTKVNPGAATFVSDKIQSYISDLTTTYAAEIDWQLMFVPKLNMLICNVSTGTRYSNLQLVANQITGAWADFDGIDAANWTLYNNTLYFGDYNGRVHQFWTGFKDGSAADGSGGVDVDAQAQQAYSYLGNLGVQKQVGMYRPNFITEGTLAYNSAVQYDFARLPIATPSGVPALTGALWNTALWNQSVWTGGESPNRFWVQAVGIGVAASLCIRGRASASALWVSTDYSYVSGSLL
jgi:hypothetical protein